MKTNKLTSLGSLQLPNRFKKVGVGIAIISMALVITQGITGIFPEWVRFLLNNLLMLGMLMVSLSKDKIEDEFVVTLRSKSYQVAFIFGIGYTIIFLPLVNFLADLIQGSAFTPLQTDYFDVLFLMLLVQLFSFKRLKRCHC